MSKNTLARVTPESFGSKERERIGLSLTQREYKAWKVEADRLEMTLPAWTVLTVNRALLGIGLLKPGELQLDRK